MLKGALINISILTTDKMAMCNVKGELSPDSVVRLNSTKHF